jgi:hypothetical protein
MNLARSYRKHVAGTLGGSHLPLLAGFEPPSDPGRHAVVTLDWWHSMAPIPPASASPAPDHRRLVEARHAAEAAAFGTLASSPRRLRAFKRLLVETQHLVPLREEQTREWTIAWPAMRTAVLRIGETLAAEGMIPEPDDVFFLTRAEAVAALGGDRTVVDVAARRTRREEQAQLVPPLMVGRVNRMLRSMWDSFPRLIGAVRSDRALVFGSPASPGRATGSVRVIRGPQSFHELQPG